VIVALSGALNMPIDLLGEADLRAQLQVLRTDTSIASKELTIDICIGYRAW